MKLPPPRIDLRGLQAIKVGVSRFAIDDPYYLILTMRWPTFLAATSPASRAFCAAWSFAFSSCSLACW